MRGLIVTAIVSLVAPAPAAAQAIPSISSNRPGIGESSALVPRRSVQVEMGLTYGRATSDGDRVTTISAPELTVRFGLARRLELFAGGDGVIVTIDPASAQGTGRAGSDLALDLKLALVDPAAHPLAVTLAAGASLPTGAASVSSGAVNPSARLLWSASLPHDFGISGNAGLASQSANGQRHATGSLSAGLSRPWGSAISWFVELFGNLVEEVRDAWTLDGGVALVPASDVQLDVSAGRRVRGDVAAWFVSGGITLRHRRDR